MIAAGSRTWRGVIEEHRARLPVTEDTPVITMGEGGTPLVPAPRLSAMTGCEVWLKIESANPTGSFKDRGMTVAVSLALARDSAVVICASTGNTSASAAAYAARAGLRCAVLVPHGNIAAGKLAQALAHGARLLEVDGSFDDCLEVARGLAETYPVTLVNSVNPDRIQGQKTAAVEVVDALGKAPDVHCLPVGGGGNITAYWVGYTELADSDEITRPPRMLGFQAAGAAPLVSGERVPDPVTVASAIRIGAPAHWRSALDAVHRSGGLIDAVTDEQILSAHRLLATAEGVFAEPASAAGVAGLLRARERGTVRAGSVVACTITGHGLKDPQVAMSATVPRTAVPASARAAAAALELA